MMRVLHIVPDSLSNPNHLYLGSTKDIFGRIEYFNARNIHVERVVADQRSDALLIKKLQRLNLDQYSAAIVENCLYPGSLQFLKEHNRNMVILTRSINAEFYHGFHQTFATIFNIKDNIRLRGILGLRPLGSSFTGFKRLYLDYLCAKQSDFILSITQWETDHYWKYLVNGSKIKTLPYFLPSNYLLDIDKEKKFQCVGLMSTTGGTLPFTLDATNNLCRVIKKLGQEGPEWNFLITGKMPVEKLGLPPRLKYTGFLKNPFDLLKESRAMAILSDYGFGFKTKLLDAICNNCYPLVTEKLYKRLPIEVQPYCITVDVKSVKSFKKALELSSNKFPEGNPNKVLRDQSYKILDSLLR